MSVREILDLASDRGALDVRLGPGWGALRVPILVVALVALANLAVAALWTWPRWTAAHASDAVVRQEQEARAILGPALEQARGSYGLVLEARDDLRDLRDRVRGRSGTVADVVSTLRAAVDAVGVDDERIDYQPQPVPELGLTQLQVSLPVRGEYGAVRELLQHLLDAPIFLVVEQIGVATPPAGSGPLQIQLTASAFVEGDVEAEEAEALGELGPEEADTAPPVSPGDPTALAQQLRARLAALPVIPLGSEDLALHLDRLDDAVGDARPSRRNLFDFAAAVVAARRERQQRLAREEAPAMPEPEEPTAPFELRGIIRADELWATLVDEEDGVHVVTAGDRLPGNYLVVEVGAVYAWLERRGERFRLSLRRDDLEEHAWAPPSRIEERNQRNRRKKKGTNP